MLRKARERHAMPGAAVLALTLLALPGGCGWVRVPASSPTAGAPAAEQAPFVRPDGAAAPGPQYPEARHPDTIVVARGDTLYSISRRHGVPVQTLIALNNLPSANGLRVGTVLRLPSSPAAPASAPVAAPVPFAPDAPRPSIDSEPLPPLSSAPPSSVPPSASPPVAAAPETPRAAPEPERVAAATAPAVPPPSARPARSGSSFLKPVAGQIVSGFGPKAGGLRNDGINISAARGTPVLAAQDGTVAYAGNELPGFGNLVLVKHPNGWISAYGHNEEILVSKGQAVRRGQPIAKVGSTGNVVQPQLHFELRNGSRAIDPVPHLADG